MPATIHCVRHAQGFHNLGPQFHGLKDPKLTPTGIEQCLNLRENLWQDQSRLSLITASALSRTLQTASLVFADALSNGNKKILAIPDAQEASDFPCDTGSDVDILQKTCTDQNWSVDLSLVHEGWNIKTMESRYSPASNAVKIRARDTRKLLQQKVKELEKSGDSNPQIVLVSHGGFLHYFTNDWENANSMMGTGWQNCETRSYTFVSDRSDDLGETMESRRRRGVEHPMLPKEKQAEWFRITMRDWKNLGVPVTHADDDDDGGDEQRPAPQVQVVA